MQEGKISNEFLRGVNGMPFYMSYTAPTAESSSIAFERNFNPMLKYDSEYFKNLEKFISCVEANTDKNLNV